MFEFGIGSIFILLVGFVMLNLGILVHLGGKTLPARAFVFAVFVSFLWAINMLLLTASTEGLFLGDFIDRLSYVLGFFVALSYSYFCIVFAKEHHEAFVRNVYLMLAIVYTYILMFTNIFTGDCFWRSELPAVGIQVWGCDPALMPFFYDISFLLIFIVGIVYIYASLKKEQDIKRKRSLNMMAISIMIGFVPPAVTSIILPSLGIYQYDWLGIMSSTLWVSVMVYSILKVKQLGVKVVMTELLVFLAVFILFIAIFV